MTTSAAHVVGCCTFLTMLLSHVTGNVITASPGQDQNRRTDGLNLLEDVAGGLSQRVDELTSNLEAQGTRMDLMATQISALRQPVAFSASLSAPDVEQITEGERLQFDKVVFNMGRAYDPSTGVFTAPATGEYAFYLHMILNVNNPQALEADIYKGHSFLLKMVVCCVGVDPGSNMAAVHLQEGETVDVRVAMGDKLLGALHASFTGFMLNPR